MGLPYRSTHARTLRQLLTSSQRGTAICIALLGYVILAGGTPGGEFNGYVRALNGAIAAGLIVRWTRALPSDNDSTDRWMTVGLFLFVATGVVSMFPRQSFDAAIQATAVLAAFYLARRKLTREGRAIIEEAMAWLCIGVSLLVVLLSAHDWLVWLQVTGGAMPPLSTFIFSGPFGHPHDVALLVCLLAPALWSPAFHLRRTIAVIGIALVAAIVVVESSRNVELAVFLASLIVILGKRVRPSTRQMRSAAKLGLAAGMALAVIVVTSPAFVSRLTSVQTLLIRVSLWTEGVRVWLSHPLAGIGPGAFPFSHMLTDFYTISSFDPRHPDNAVVQLLVEGGIIGVAGGLVCAFGLAKAAWKRFRVEPRAVWALLVFAFASLGANPTDFIFLITPAVLWAAILVPPDPVAGGGPTIVPKTKQVGVRVASQMLAAVVVAAIAVMSVASIVYEFGRAAYLRGDIATAAAAVGIAAEIDPSLSIYQREGASLAFARGDYRRAADGYGRALALVPYDPVAWRGLALALSADGETVGATKAAREAVHLMYLSTENQLVVAAVSAQNDPPASRAALKAALYEAPQLAVISWQHTVLKSSARVDMVRSVVNAEPPGDAEHVISQVVLALIANRPDVATAAALRVKPSERSSADALAAGALAAVGVCRFEEAAGLRDAALRTEGGQASIWLARSLVADAVGSKPSESAALDLYYLGLSGGPGPPLTSALGGDISDTWRFRRPSLGVVADGAMLPAARAALWILVTDPATALAPYGSAWPPPCPKPSER